MTKHAVLTDTHVVYISEKARQLVRVPLEQDVNHISELWAVGQEMGISHWWVMPDTMVDGLGADFVAARDGYKIFIPGELGEGCTPRAATCKKGYARDIFEIYVQWPVHGDGFGWLVNHPLDILAAVDYLSQLLCTDDITYTPQYVGKQFLKGKYKATKRLQSYIRKPENDLSSIPFRKASPEIYFTQTFTADMQGKYLHFYDKNSAHPSAASSVITGCGEPVHLTENIEAKLPGIYRVTCAGKDTMFDGVHLPTIIDSEWVTLDILKFAVKNGYTINIHEAYVFEQKHNIFGEWARDLWQIRQMLKDETAFVYGPGRQNAYYTVKMMMNNTISAQQNINWWADMVGMARVARLYNFAKFAGEGQYPAIVYVDDVAYVSAEENPAAAVPGILERHDKLGGFKHKYTLELTEEVINALCEIAGDKPSRKAGRLLTYCNRVAREKGLIDG